MATCGAEAVVRKDNAGSTQWTGVGLVSGLRVNQVDK
jgi:hypothetical protein